MNEILWDYTDLADSYSQRPSYADAAVDAILATAALRAGDPVLDMGAGTGHLTLKLAARGLDVTASEPNPRMRAIGVERTGGLSNVRWQAQLMQRTSLPAASFALVTYGASFGLADYTATLSEAHRLLRPGGSIACLFNYRDLEDPLQRDIEALIHKEVPDYDYGNRRQDQAPFIATGGYFRDVRTADFPFVQAQSRETWLAGWSSHATLARQAGDRFAAVVAAIEALVRQRCGETVQIPYTTRLWTAHRA